MKQFKNFSRPVPEEQLEYHRLIVQPVCFKDMLAHLNERKYFSAREFLSDIDLMVSNAKEFGEAMGNSRGMGTVNEACHMQDTALSFVCQFNVDLAGRCETIAKRRRKALQHKRYGTPPPSSTS